MNIGPICTRSYLHLGDFVYISCAFLDGPWMHVSFRGTQSVKEDFQLSNLVVRVNGSLKGT